MNDTDLLARLAVEPITNGMIVGLGTGRAATRGIHALAERVNQDSLKVECVATSEASGSLARELGLTVLPFAQVERVDYLFDGADEVAPDLAMLKGRGGAMTREKIVAQASARRIYLIDESKLVRHIGARFDLPIEVLPFALASVRAQLADIGLEGPIRTREGGEVYHTDNGFVVMDAPIPETADIEGLDESLAAIDGVLGHGLFLNEADEVLVESKDRSDVKRLSR